MEKKSRFMELLEDAEKRWKDPGHVTPFHLTVGSTRRTPASPAQRDEPVSALTQSRKARMGHLVRV